MTIEDRLRKIVSVLPEQASVTLPVLLVKEWLEVEAVRATSPTGCNSRLKVVRSQLTVENRLTATAHNP